MGEAVAALSLAANILQVVQCGLRFVSVAWGIYRSGQGGVDIFSDLHTISNDLEVVLRQIQTDAPGSAPQNSASSCGGIFQLAEECAKVARQMLDSLENLGLPEKGRKREALKAAFKLTWRSDDIKSLQRRLEEFRSQLILNLVVSLRYVVGLQYFCGLRNVAR
jgi:hypothetical protein